MSEVELDHWTQNGRFYEAKDTTDLPKIVRQKMATNT
jgi:hypothetical protein